MHRDSPLETSSRGSGLVLSSILLPPPIDRALVLSRVTRRLIPFAFICYVVAYIDRVNIGFAARELRQDLGLSATQYGLGAGLFFLGYCLFEIPSNLVLERVGARLWIARIMIVWGLVSMATMFIYDVTSFMAARIILGIAEAGFFPGMVLYVTYWIPANERVRVNALFMMAAPVSVIVGAPVSEALLSMHGLWGLRGWQWLFLLEGLPAVILGVMALKILTDRPEQADLSPRLSYEDDSDELPLGDDEPAVEPVPLHQRWYVWTGAGAVVATGVAFGVKALIDGQKRRLTPPEVCAPSPICDGVLPLSAGIR